MGIFTGISLFSGAGGLDIAARRAGIRTVCYVEKDPYAQGVLMSRIRDGHLDRAPIWDDISTFEGRSWHRRVDIVFGGFPCQDLSHVGLSKGILRGPKSSLWWQFQRIIKESQPRYVVIENVPGLLSRGFEYVLHGLYKSGYDALWYCLDAGSMGAPHRRDRLWVIGYPQHTYPYRVGLDRAVIDEHREGTEPWGVKFQDKQISFSRQMVQKILREGIEPEIFGMADGMADRSHRIRRCGEGVVPDAAFVAFQKIKDLAGV